MEVSLELTHRCSFRCVHCYVPDFAAPDLLATDRVLGLLDELADAGTLFLALTGGEVFLRADWRTIARRARSLGFGLTFLTNGYLVDEVVAAVLAELAARVEVSVHATDPRVMDGITGRPGSCDRARRAVERLGRLGVDVVVKTPVMSRNVDEVARVGAWAAEVGAGFSAIPTIVSRKDGDPAPLAVRASQEALRAFYTGPCFDCGGAKPAEPDPDSPPCAAGRRFCSITPAGDVLACSILPGSAGNVRERSFREIWEGSPWLAQLRGIRLGDLRDCRACPELSTCGRCPAQALVEDGDLLGRSAFACERSAFLGEVREGGAGVPRAAENAAPGGGDEAVRLPARGA